MWIILKNKIYSNNLCTEGDMKGVTQYILSRHQQNFDVQWITCLLDAKNACELKGIISNTCFQYSY